MDAQAGQSKTRCQRHAASWDRDSDRLPRQLLARRVRGVQGLSLTSAHHLCVGDICPATTEMHPIHPCGPQAPHEVE